MSKVIQCKTCSKEIASNAKTCPGCGAKNKKPIYKRPWFIVIVFLIIVVAIGEAGDNSSTSSDEVEQVISQDNNAEEVDSVEESEEAEEVELASYESVKSEAIDILEKNFGKNGKVNVYEDEENGIVMFSVPSPDGIVEGVAAINSGIANDELIGSYEDMKEKFIGLSKNMFELGQTCGKNFAIGLQNNQNSDNVLLTVLNGVVIQETVKY